MSDRNDVEATPWYGVFPCSACPHCAPNRAIYGGKQEVELCDGPHYCITKQIPPEFRSCPFCDSNMILQSNQIEFWLICSNSNCIIHETKSRKDIYELALNWNFPRRKKK